MSGEEIMRIILATIAIVMLATPSWGAIGDTYYCEKIVGYEINQDLTIDVNDDPFSFKWNKESIDFTYQNGDKLNVSIHKQNDNGFVLLETQLYDQNDMYEIVGDRFNDKTNLYSFVSVYEDKISAFQYKCSRFKQSD